MFLTGYRHFYWKKGKVKQDFIYENAQKKMLENCNFCPDKSLILLNKKVYEPCKDMFPIYGTLSIRNAFQIPVVLTHLAKDNVSFCHPMASVVC
jgi:hypothetical protein